MAQQVLQTEGVARGAAGVAELPTTSTQSLLLSSSATLPSTSVCGVLFFRNTTNAPRLQRHAHSFQARGTSKVALDDIFLELQELSLKHPAFRV